MGEQRNGSRKAAAAQPDLVRFELEVQRLPVAARAELLAWLRTWRRRPGRVFWVMRPTGGWQRL